MDRHAEPTAESVWKEYEKGKSFKNQIDLFDTVETNENFFIGKQWEGVKANGLPTPVFNFLKRVVLFQVASILSDNIKMQCTPLSAAADAKYIEQVSQLISAEFDSLFEHNKIGSILREYMRNAAVDGDGCTYTYWDPDVNTGQAAAGAIVTELIENTRVHFGNPNERRVQRQPYIIIESRETLKNIRRKAKENGVTEFDRIRPDDEGARTYTEKIADDGKATVLLRLWKDDDGEIWGIETIRGLVIRDKWDLGIKLYPITWLNWDYVQNSYHGMAMITGLIPNQIFVNKAFAMVQLSIMQSAFPKIVYDKTRIKNWTNQAGAAIGVNGGDVSGVARVIEPAQVSPQISQFIQTAIDYTQTFLGATSAAMGDTRPDNTSAIIALQRASAVPSEMTKQNLYQSVEDLGRIYIAFMAANYGVRIVKAPAPDLSGLPIEAKNISAETMEFDFTSLEEMPMSLKLDVGASTYWSEIASMQSLDNLLMNGHIDIVEYLERVPSGYISKKQELIDGLKRRQAPPAAAPAAKEEEPEIPLTAGNSALQRKIVASGAAEHELP